MGNQTRHLASVSVSGIRILLTDTICQTQPNHPQIVRWHRQHCRLNICRYIGWIDKYCPEGNYFYLSKLRMAILPISNNNASNQFSRCMLQIFLKYTIFFTASLKQFVYCQSLMLKYRLLNVCIIFVVLCSRRLCWFVCWLCCLLCVWCLCRWCWIVCWLCCLLTSGIRLWMLGSLPDHFSHTVPPPTFYQVSSTFVCLIFFPLSHICHGLYKFHFFLRIFDT